MPDKNLGPSAGYLNPEGRAWESVVFQVGKPVLDRELGLSSDLDSGAAQEVLKRLMPSGWLSDDFLGTSNLNAGVFNPSAVSNQLEIPACLAHVNGWMIRVEGTNASTAVNRVDLGSAPTGNGANRTELVFLEVWRRLIAAAPDTNGKSGSGRIWRNGNVRIASADDSSKNFVDDLKDVNVNAETTRRVQIQYRLRVVRGVDIVAHPYGLSDPAVVARTVPPNATTPDGAVAQTAFTYTNQSANGDPGLWRAGDGVPSNGLGTVDGYMYAIPLCAVFRRNSTSFNRLSNMNGAGTSPGASGRPDGLFHNIIVASDVLDLRTGVSPTGWSPEEVLTKNLHLLLDNGLRQEVVSTAPDGGGSYGTTVLRANEIGGLPTTAGPLIGQFDSVRRRFSDRATYETVTVRCNAPGGTWNNYEVVTIDPVAFRPYPQNAFNWHLLAPTGAMIVDITDLYWAGTTASKKYVDAFPWVTSITGVGANPRSTITINLGYWTDAGLGLTDEFLFATLLIMYPRDGGLSHTPVASYGDSSFEVPTGPFSTSAPVSFSAFATRAIDPVHREVQIEYTTTPQTWSFGSGAAPANVIYRLPERANSLVSVVTTPPQPQLPTLDDSGRVLQLSATPAPNTLISVTYVALRPVPAAQSAKMVVYFRAAAPATVSRTILGTSLTADPKLVSDKLLSLTVGSGSQDECYPFPQAYVQTGGIFSSRYSGESELAASAAISVANFSAETGMLMLPTYIPMAASPESLVFTRNATHVDIEDRTYFPFVPSGYVPNAYAQDLSSAGRHKNVLPILAELSQDTGFGLKGQLVLVLLVRYAPFDATNGVFFDAANPYSTSTSASVFRVRGLLLNKRVS